MYQKFKELLEKTGKTTADVCRETGIAQTTISNWKNRGGVLSANNLQILAKYFGVTMEFFLEA